MSIDVQDILIRGWEMPMGPDMLERGFNREYVINRMGGVAVLLVPDRTGLAA